jgi:hypothetical protein
MRAIQITEFGNPAEVLRVLDLPEPSAPGAGEVKVAVELSPLNWTLSLGAGTPGASSTLMVLSTASSQQATKQSLCRG